MPLGGTKCSRKQAQYIQCTVQVHAYVPVIQNFEDLKYTQLHKPISLLLHHDL
jgi:hypothetical protein